MLLRLLGAMLGAKTGTTVLAGTLLGSAVGCRNGFGRGAVVGIGDSKSDWAM